MMEKIQKYPLSDILVGAVLCLLIVLSVFTWNLATEVRNLQTATQQQSPAPTEVTPVAQVQNAPATQNQQANNAQASTDPFPRL